MPSIFSRSRTQSTPRTPSSYTTTSITTADEFGRVSTPLPGGSMTASQKSRKKKGKKELADEYEPPPIPDGSFLTLNLSGESSAKYGYLAHSSHVVLGLDQLSRLVDVVTGELGSRGGITTPFIFSSLALDIRPPAIQRLIKAFLGTCEISTGGQAEERWREEARFAGPHELGMCLRWALARTVRVMGGQEVRGLLGWQDYELWREDEFANNFPPAAFTTFLPPLQPALRSILITLLSLLTRLTANSASSGHTPPTLSPLFGPLLFGLGPSSTSFHAAYAEYLRATNATEHLLLAFIRWQDVGMGVPTRLKEWIKGYPSILPSANATGNRKGARTVRVLSVRRNVRAYTPDLVKSASTWAGVSGSSNAFAKSREWERITYPGGSNHPRFSDQYRKRMNLPASVQPEVNPSLLPHSLSSSTSSTSGYSDFSLSLSRSTSTSTLGGGGSPAEERFRSLTDLKWGEFESLGFDSLGSSGGASAEQRLKFDLTESARNERTRKRQTLTWNDFSSSGFTRTDAPLSTTLQFSLASPLSSPPLSQPIPSTPQKLAKHKKQPVFGWDTTPVLGGEEVIEEAFLDVFCDLIGGTWTDGLGEGGQFGRDCNWALVEYKSLPSGKNNSTSVNAQDSRTGTTLILFEEFVPLEYRQQLAGVKIPSGDGRKRLNSLFSSSDKGTSSSSKPFKPPATLNGRPYTPGLVPKSPSSREAEFEGLLKGGGVSTTKILSLSTPPTTPGLPPKNQPDLPPAVSSASAHSHSEESSIVASPLTPSKSATTHLKPKFIRKRESMRTPAEYSTVDFEARLASDDDDDGFPDEKRKDEDAWVDILVGRERMNDQAAVMRGGRRRGGGGGDPDAASMEVEKALAGVVGRGGDRSPTPKAAGGGNGVKFAGYDDDEPEPLLEPVDYRDSVFTANNGVVAYDADSIEIQTIPRSNTQPAYVDSMYSDADDEDDGTDEDEDGDVLSKYRTNKRPGYFDLHPERRPISETDPRDLLHDSDDDEDAIVPVKRDEPLRPLPVAPIPRALPHPPPATPAVVVESSGQKSRTAALIEMYREKERGATSTASAKPPSPPSRTPTTTPPKEDLSPAALLEETGRNSPARYVHGAPLHNVLEEEEED